VLVNLDTFLLDICSWNLLLLVLISISNLRDCLFDFLLLDMSEKSTSEGTLFLSSFNHRSINVFLRGLSPFFPLISNTFGSRLRVVRVLRSWINLIDHFWLITISCGVILELLVCHLSTI
jgi:hypothetical protein